MSQDRAASGAGHAALDRPAFVVTEHICDRCGRLAYGPSHAGCTAQRFAYADPPYVGQARKHYGSHPDFAGEVDHAALIERLCDEFDGWALSLSMKSLPQLLRLCPVDVITLAWFKPIAPPLGDHRRYNWEPVILRPLRRYVPGYVPTAVVASPPQFTFREKPETHVIGEKPEAFAHWVFASAGLMRDDVLVDLFPGSGAISRAWVSYTPGPTVSDGYQAAKEAS